jgi:hypothetical protein
MPISSELKNAYDWVDGLGELRNLLECEDVSSFCKRLAAEWFEDPDYPTEPVTVSQLEQLREFLHVPAEPKFAYPNIHNDFFLC